MARVTGGITGRPSGKVAGIVFGAARTRRGKVVTARELVPPSNPQTPAQTTQRDNFYVANEAVKQLGPAIYQGAFNRSVGQLPGYQALVSTIVRSTASDGTMTPPAPMPLGNLTPFKDLAYVDAPTPGQVNVSWDDAFVGNGTPNDTITIFAIQAEADGPLKKPRNVYKFEAVTTRADGSVVITLPDADGEYIFTAYAEKAGVSVPVYSTSQSDAVAVT